MFSSGFSSPSSFAARNLLSAQATSLHPLFFNGFGE